MLALSIVDCAGFVYVCVVREAYGRKAPNKRYCMNGDHSVNATPCYVTTVECDEPAKAFQQTQ